jgi:hypothetical protein
LAPCIISVGLVVTPLMTPHFAAWRISSILAVSKKSLIVFSLPDMV